MLDAGDTRSSFTDWLKSRASSAYGVQRDIMDRAVFIYTGGKVASFERGHSMHEMRLRRGGAWKGAPRHRRGKGCNNGTNAGVL